MTDNREGSDKKSSAEKKAPTQDQAEREDVNITVSPSAPVARARLEEQQPRLQPSSSHIHLQLGGSRTSMPPPPSPARMPQSSGGGGSSDKASTGVPVVITGGGIQVGGSAEGASGGAGITSGAARPLKRKSEVVAPAGVRPICSVCNRDFYSWKALFGHMRSHPDRAWRGCFPPPVAQGQHLDEANLQASAPRAAMSAEASGEERRGPRGLNIDLNEPQDAQEFGAGTPAVNKKDGGPADIDINMPPPSDDEDIA